MNEGIFLSKKMGKNLKSQQLTTQISGYFSHLITTVSFCLKKYYRMIKEGTLVTLDKCVVSLISTGK